MDLPEMVKFACTVTDDDKSPSNDKHTVIEAINEHEERIERFRTTITPEHDYEVVIGGDSDRILTTIAKTFARKIDKKKRRGSKYDHLNSTRLIGINGFLLYGLSGTGKTTMIKSVAVRIAKLLKTDISFINVNSAELMDKFVGESQKLIEALYRVADKRSPTLICVDEIDGFCGKRKDNEEQHVRSFKTQFLSSMCGVVPHPYVLTAGSSNKPWDLDFALLRRFEMKYNIQLPKPIERIQIMQNAVFAATERHSNEHPMLDLESPLILKLTEGFTGSDLLSAIIMAVEKVTLITHEGIVLSDDEFQLLEKEIENSDVPIGYTVGYLDNDALIQFGIKCIAPSYDMNEVERLKEFARGNSVGNNHRNENAQGTQSTSLDLLSLLCCCIRC